MDSSAPTGEQERGASGAGKMASPADTTGSSSIDNAAGVSPGAGASIDNAAGVSPGAGAPERGTDVATATPWGVTLLAFALALWLISGALAESKSSTDLKTTANELSRMVAEVRSIRDWCFAFVRDPITPALNLLPIPVLKFVMILPAVLMWPFVGLLGLAFTPLLWLTQLAATSVRLATVFLACLRVSAPVFGATFLGVSVGLVLGQRWAVGLGRMMMLLAVVGAPVGYLIGGWPVATLTTAYALSAWRGLPRLT